MNTNWWWINKGFNVQLPKILFVSNIRFTFLLWKDITLSPARIFIENTLCARSWPWLPQSYTDKKDNMRRRRKKFFLSIEMQLTLFPSPGSISDTSFQGGAPRQSPEHLDTWNFICSYSTVNVGHMPNFGPSSPPGRSWSAKKGQNWPFLRILVNQSQLPCFLEYWHETGNIWNVFFRATRNDKRVKILLWRHQRGQN